MISSLPCILFCASLFNCHFLGRLQVEQQQSFPLPPSHFLLLLAFSYPFYFCSLHFVLSLVSYSEMFNKIIKGGELLPVSLQPCAEALSGRGSYRICWISLTWPKDIMPAMHFHVWTMPPPPPPLQYRHEAPPWYGAMYRDPSFVYHPVGGFYPSLAGIFPAQLCQQENSVFFVSARHNINTTRFLGLALLNFARHCPINTTRFEMVT